MVKDVFSFALVTVGILSMVVGFWGIYITAILTRELLLRLSMLGYVSELRVVFWNVILFATLIGAGGIAIGYAVGKKYA
jgi:hypothetical protein